jgi:HipA-like protein
VTAALPFESRLRTVAAVRYVTPLREGGSLPAIVEADDEGLYVLKFRGAGQGPRALIAELLAGEIARCLELPVPEIVFMELPGELARTEPDPEIQSLIRASAGLNLALDYLPGSITFDPLVYKPDADLASAIVWFDALVCNVDRTARNVNMLLWHRRLWLIDHGAALYFHHDWKTWDRQAVTAFPLIKDHVLLGFAGALSAADARLKPLLSREKLSSLIDLIPDSWLAQDPGAPGIADQRHAYLEFLCERLRSSEVFVSEAIRARGAPS